MKKLKIAFIYGRFCSNDKTFNIPNLMNDPQGLTGSETSYFFFAREMQKRGHNINLYMHNNDNYVSQYGSHQGNIDETFDVIYIWNEPCYVEMVKTNSLVMCNIQINNLIENPIYEYLNNKIHIYTSPSDNHRERMQKTYSNLKSDREIIYNAVDPTWFNLNLVREPYTLMYASSPDRGLHNLLQCYPMIKKEVPKAKLKIYFDKWHSSIMNNSSNDPLFLEIKNRAEYIKYALNEMKSGFDLIHIKNISKKQICEEMCKTTVLAYPFSAPSYTEGFSCVAMESCAAGMVPVLSKQDALDSLYGKAAIMIDAPIEQHLDEFTEKVILALTDKKLQEETREKCIALSKQYYFSDEVIKLENLMYEGLKKFDKGAI